MVRRAAPVPARRHDGALTVDASVAEWALRAAVVSVVGALVAAVVRLIGRIRANEIAVADARQTADSASTDAATATSSAGSAMKRVTECERVQTEMCTRLDAYPPPAEWRQWSADLAAMRASMDGVRDMVVGLSDRMRAIDAHLREPRP